MPVKIIHRFDGRNDAMICLFLVHLRDLRVQGQGVPGMYLLEISCTGPVLVPRRFPYGAHHLRVWEAGEQPGSPNRRGRGGGGRFGVLGFVEATLV